MNILFCCVPFSPSVGGIETVSAILREQFARAGHRVVLVTQTEAKDAQDEQTTVVRRPSARRLFELVRAADVVFHNNISLRLAWPLLLLRRPWVVAHHTWIPRVGLAARAKRRLLRHARQIAVSRALADDLAGPCTVIPNPYADDRFGPAPGVARVRELVFVGRLVSDKGAALLLDALALLRQRGRRIGLTLIGDGPEAPVLRRQAAASGLSAQVEFAGQRAGQALVEALNAHQVLVVPSVWEEPFGVVVLEALACGCVPLVFRSGGLPEAVGAAGLVVPRRDVSALAEGIETLLGDPEARARYLAQAPAHLARHTPERIARDYLHVIDDARLTNAAQSDPRAA